MDTEIGGWIHFCVIGDFCCLKSAYYNERTSILDLPILAKIKEWHVKYKLNCRLYINKDLNGFHADLLDELYGNELGKEISWLRIEDYTENKAIKSIETGICLDELLDESALETVLRMCKERIDSHLYNDQIQAYLSEYRFARCQSMMEWFWVRAAKIKKTLYINTTTLVQDYLYFTTCNTDYLFKINIENEEVEVVAELPCETLNVMKFSTMALFETSVWMIPCMENFIMVYQIESGQVKRFPLPYDYNDGKGIPKFRKCIQNGRDLWLLPVKAKCIIRIDMKYCVTETFTNWPQGITFSDDCKANFKSMCISGNYLYLFKDGCSHNIRMDITKKIIEAWDIKVNGRFGIVVGDNKLIAAPVFTQDSVLFYNNARADVCKSYVLPQWVWNNEQYYAFWYCQVIDDDIYIMPHEANAIIKFNVRKKDLQLIKLDLENYKTLRPYYRFAGYEVVKIHSYIWIIPFMGNQILKITNDAKVSNTIESSVTISKIKPCVRFYKHIISESPTMMLSRYIRFLGSFDDKKWTEQGNTVGFSYEETYGNKIYRSMFGQ